MNEFCRPRTSVIAQPGALITTQKGIREVLNAKKSCYELITLINQQFEDWKKDNHRWKKHLADTIAEGQQTIYYNKDTNLFENIYLRNSFPVISLLTISTAPTSIIRCGFAELDLSPSHRTGPRVSTSPPIARLQTPIS